MKGNFLRLGDRWLYTDVVLADNIKIRIGSMPDVSKILKKKNIKSEYVILPPLNITQAGDNYTGEEFVLWNKIYSNDFTPITYIGDKNNIKFLYRILKKNINQTFNKNKTRIIKVNRIKNLIKLKIVKPDEEIRLSEKVKIKFFPSNIIIYENEKSIYNYIGVREPININQEVDKLLSPFNKKNQFVDQLEIIPLGTGNGFRGRTSNFLIRYGDRIIWMDVMAKPFLALEKVKIHWDNITDYFISHIHEDHISGLSAVFMRAIYKNKKVNIITTAKIMKEIKKRFYFLFPDIDYIVNHINIIPDTILPYYHGFLMVRLNHHVLKSGTLGLKVKYKDNIVAISGDTYYSEELAKRFPEKSAFDINWFNDCQLIFHEVEFENPHTVHTFYTELKKMQEKVKGKILTYHYSSEKPLLPVAKEFKRYIIKDGKLKISN